MNAVSQMRPIDEFRLALEETSFTLPAHIPAERYRRVVLTAVQVNPELLECSRRSLFLACQKAAADGLLPDGREAALVVRRDKKSPTGKSASYQPMIAGLRKKARNSGEIATWDAHVVYENDHFQFQLGDAPQVNHSYDLRQARGAIIGAYSVALLKDGSKSYEVMSIAEIHAIRDMSDGWRAFKAGKITSTPWSASESEMCRKTVARRHSKVLPTSTDLDDLIRRDDDLYDMQGASDKQVATERPRGLSARLDALGGPDLAHDAETGEIIDNEIAGSVAGNEASANGPKVPPQGGRDAPPIQQARSGGGVQPASSPAEGEPQQEPPREQRVRQEVGRGEAPTSAPEARQSIVDEFLLAARECRSADVLEQVWEDYQVAFSEASTEEKKGMRQIYDAALARLSPRTAQQETLERAYQRGREAKRSGAPYRSVPGEYREAGFEGHLAEWRRGYEDEADEAKSKDGWSP